MKIYTRTGDDGETGLFGGERVGKGHLRVEAYGTVDELNACLGLCLSTVQDQEIRSRLGGLQHDLFKIGSSLATPGSESGTARPSIPPLPHTRIAQMEEWIDAAAGETDALRNFIVPGGSPGAASLHVARTVCRRAERTVARLRETDGADPAVLRYLNRLSDLLFALARLENHRLGVGDVVWDPGEGA